MDNWIWFGSLGGSLLVSAVSLVGSYVLLLRRQTLTRLIPVLVSLAVGVMLGDAFLHLLPEAIIRTGDLQGVMLCTLGGIFLFFLLEKVVRWRHHQHHLLAITQPKPFGLMNLAGDAVHNLIDGILIASGFLVSPLAGSLTTLALLIHEVPQEIGDVGALIQAGYSRRQAIWYNFLCSLPCVLGAILTLVFSSYLSLPLLYMLPLAAGGFIYVAASDLIPELHRYEALRQQMGQSAAMLGGVAAMYLLILFENYLTKFYLWP